MEVPAEWEAALRALSPIREEVPWLALRWFRMQKPDDHGIMRDAGRWILSECVHESLVTLADPDTDIIAMLSGPPPSTMKDPRQAQARATFANDYQCMMYRTHRVWARELWIIQGDSGGHPVQYTDQEAEWNKTLGLPTDPPALGTLPYAPFDARVIARMRNRNRLMLLGGNIDRLRKSGKAYGSEWLEAEKEFRKQHWQHIEESTEYASDFLRYYASSSKTATECRNAVPEMSRETANEAEVAKDMYIETGRLPVALPT